MSSLSPEDRQRIYDEEKIRLAAQEELRLENKKKDDTVEGRNFLIACVIVGAIIWYAWSYISNAMEQDAVRQINFLIPLLQIL